MKDKREEGEGWIGFDLDGTLANYNGWVDETDIGDPIEPMIDLVKSYLRQGKTVKIFTARVTPKGQTVAMLNRIRKAIQNWTHKYIGQRLEVVCCKDHDMEILYDDRAIQVEKNTGKLIGA